MQAKQEMEAIKALNEKVNTIESKTILNKLKITLQNNWSSNGESGIFKANNIVFVDLSLRNGTGRVVTTLPEGYRPSQTLMRTLVGNNGNIGYVLVAISGEITFERISLPTTNNETFMTSFTFRVI